MFSNSHDAKNNTAEHTLIGCACEASFCAQMAPSERMLQIRMGRGKYTGDAAGLWYAPLAIRTTSRECLYIGAMVAVFRWRFTKWVCATS